MANTEAHERKTRDNTRNIYVARNGKFEVHLRRDGVLYSIGTFITKQEAIDARDKWLKKHR